MCVCVCVCCILRIQWVNRICRRHLQDDVWNKQFMRTAGSIGEWNGQSDDVAVGRSEANLDRD